MPKVINGRKELERSLAITFQHLLELGLFNPEKLFLRVDLGIKILICFL